MNFDSAAQSLLYETLRERLERVFSSRVLILTPEFFFNAIIPKGDTLLTG
ncbi:hypothetical protein [Nostoc sp. NMS8]|nr:hypothetical protein [Nostoc sp. NMS8]MBN3959797.1 hypothetical protein [Nostoc sp. NMS8]